MKLFVKTLLLSVIALTLSLGTANQVQAQSKKSKAKTSKTTKTRPVVYGTEYDWLSTRYATEWDCSECDEDQLRIYRNSIYARHGRYFKSADLNRFFYRYSWYQPYRNEVPESELNKYEKANIKFIKRIEDTWWK